MSKKKIRQVKEEMKETEYAIEDGKGAGEAE